MPICTCVWCPLHQPSCSCILCPSHRPPCTCVWCPAHRPQGTLPAPLPLNLRDVRGITGPWRRWDGQQRDAVAVEDPSSGYGGLRTACQNPHSRLATMSMVEAPTSPASTHFGCRGLDGSLTNNLAHRMITWKTLMACRNPRSRPATMSTVGAPISPASTHFSCRGLRRVSDYPADPLYSPHCQPQRQLTTRFPHNHVIHLWSLNRTRRTNRWTSRAGTVVIWTVRRLGVEAVALCRPTWRNNGAG